MKYTLNRLVVTLGLAFSFSTSFAALEFKIPAPEDVCVVTQYNNGFGPVIGKSLARVEADFRAYGDKLGSAVVDWSLTGKFRTIGRFTPRYVRGETFLSC